MVIALFAKASGPERGRDRWDALAGLVLRMGCDAGIVGQEELFAKV